MSLVLDLIVLAIILLCIVISAKRGFVKALIETVGFVLAIFLAFTISEPLAVTTYDKLLEPPVVTAVAESGVQSSEDIADKIFEALPKLITDNLSRLGVETESVKENINTTAQNGIEETVSTVSQNVIKPVAVEFIGLLYSVLLAIIFMILVKPIAKIVNKLFSFSIIGKLNSGLGAILGLVQGVVFATVFCMVIATVVSFTQNGFLIFTPTNIDASNIFKFFTRIF